MFILAQGIETWRGRSNSHKSAKYGRPSDIDDQELAHLSSTEILAEV